MSEPNLLAQLPAPVAAALLRVRAVFFAFSRPARIMLIATTTMALAIGGFVVFQRANEAYAPLFSQLDREDASAIVAKLKELKVPYRLAADGATIEVPESKTHELRLELAGGGLPRGGGVGFESFDKMRLGATDFEQRVLYRRALEGELTRTIATIGAVESSRVHLVLPEKSVFVTRSEPASASIILRLRPGRTLGASEVAAIVHLVSAAVPSLEPDHVAVVTTDGTTLHRPRKGNGGDDALGGDEDARSLARSYESTIEERVRAMLERVVGPGHADVRVTAEIEAARVERVEDRYDPTKSALRSEEQSIEHTANDTEESVAGVPGAESNLPNGAAKGAEKADGGALLPTAAAPASTNVRESHTRNFEIDHVTEKRVSAGGALRRVTVAVVLDGSKDAKGNPRATMDLDKLAALVRSAAGTSEARGDIVTLESIPFVDNPDAVAEETTQGAGALSTRMALAKKYGPYALGGLVVIVVAVGVLARRGRRAPLPVVTPMAEIAAVAPAPHALPEETSPALAALDSGDLRTRAHSRAAQDPATAALVLRFWLGTSTPEAREQPKV